MKNPEYTYFRAEGRTLAAVESAAREEALFTKMRATLAARFGAETIMGWPDKDTGLMRVDCFVFRNENLPPSDWTELNRQVEKSSGKIQAIFARPRPGSPDDFFVTDYAGLMQRPAQRSQLEKLLACGEMPMKDLPAGRYTGAFVRWSTLEDLSVEEAKPSGLLHDPRTMCFGSSSRCQASDPLSTMKMQGGWYLRVPNGPDGTPRFVPPDSTPVAYEDMLALDRNENLSRFVRARSAGFDPSI